MSLKIEPLCSEERIHGETFSRSEDRNHGETFSCSEGPVHGETLSCTEVVCTDIIKKYPFLRLRSSMVKLKKPCSARTCNSFDCRKILPEQRALIHKLFWIEMDPEGRLNYVVNNTEYKANQPQNDSFLYFLSVTGVRFSVCSKMFLSSLSLVGKDAQQIIKDHSNKLKMDSPNEIPKPESKKSKKKIKTPKKEPTIKIEYVEVNNSQFDYDFDSPVDALDLGDEKIIEQKQKATMKPIRKNVKRFTSKKAKKYTSEESSDELEDISKQNRLGSELSEISCSDSKESTQRNLKTPLIMRSRRKANAWKTTTPICKKKKSEPQSDLSDNDFSSDDEADFSHVEDTDDSDFESGNISQSNEFKQTQDVKCAETQYYSNGTDIPPIMGQSCSSILCSKLEKRKCRNINEWQRQEIFNNFWQNLSLLERKNYIQQNVEIFEQKGRAKNLTPLIYHLKFGEEKFEVCQRMFHSTLALKYTCVYDWILASPTNKKFEEDDIQKFLDPLDTMPKTVKARRRFENYYEKLQLLEDFLDSLDKMPQKSFPQQKSHKHYLTEKIEGLRDLQKLYKETMKKEGINNYLPIKVLKKVFCAKNFTFYTGYKKRQAKFKTIDDTEITPEIQELMQRDLQERQRDKILTKKPGSNIIILDIDTCDGKVSPNWNGDGDESEPNSRLSCFNFTVSNMVTLHSFNYWFCEVDALDTTPSSFITCLIDYLNNFCLNAKQIIIYSRIGDKRFKNIDMTNALLDFSILNKIVIIQKFYIPRKHLYKDETECQSIYRSLYRKLRRFEVNLPSDYLTATIDCKREPTEAKWMHYNQFRDYSIKSKKHLYLSLWTNIDEIDKIKSIICTHNTESVSIKMDFDDDWIDLPDSLKINIKETNIIDWPQLYYNRQKISPIKYQLLQSLKITLPRDCHFFYDYLTFEI